MVVRLFAFLLGFLHMSNIYAGSVNDEMHRLVGEIETTFDNYYAPLEWKTSHNYWDKMNEIANLKQLADSTHSVEEFQRALKQFFANTRDYHTSIYFADNSTSNLPISIKYIEGNYFVSFVDDRLSANFPLMVGDQVIKFDGRLVDDVAYELMGYLSQPSLTDWELAARSLTKRSGARLDVMSTGPIIVEALRGEKKITAQLIWNYDDVSIPYSSTSENNAETQNFYINENLPVEAKDDLFKLMDYLQSGKSKVELFDFESPAQNRNYDPQSLGKKKSFLPRLGTTIWEAPEEGPFDAYIYMNDEKQLVGFIRINRYAQCLEKIHGEIVTCTQEFAKIIKKMEEVTDLLVIDQLNNPGGSVLYLYALASMLTDKPLATPGHQITLDSAMAFNAHKFLKMIDKLNDYFSQPNDLMAMLNGYPIDMQFLAHQKSYFQFVLDQWSKGKLLTDPYYISGVDYIQPNAFARYTKKIIILTNALDFSGGDFFPAIMQDNNRATIMGTQTAGAGGYVLKTALRNNLGVMGFSYTSSIAYRPSGAPIENLGIEPDVYYQISPKDLKKNFLPFRKAINEQIKLELASTP